MDTVVAIFRHYAIPVLSLGLGLAGCWWLATRRNVVEAVFSSFKEAANAKTASPNTRASFKALRALLREYGVKALEDELAAGGLVKDGMLTTGTKPFNLFARIGAAEMSQPEMAASNALLGEAGSRFVVCCNRAENDEHWQSSAPEWVGKASMSQRHRFLTVRDLDWRWFNAVSFGIGGGDELRRAITRMEEVLATAKAFAKADGWSGNVGFFFHVYPHNSVQSFHLHIVDLDVTGPTYEVMKYKNIPAEEVLAVLRAEAAGQP